MSIELTCSSCNQRLRVSNDDAGKQARCPACSKIMSVPGGSAELRLSAGPGLWHVKLEDGTSYGPVEKSELDEWVSQGRITANTQLRRDGDPQSSPATEMYPSLRSGTTAKSGPGIIFSDPAPSHGANPYVSPQTPRPGPGQGRYAAPHRGAMVLVLALLGWTVCQLFCPFAWAMGANDLREMRAGRMDSSGYGMTQAGVVLGIIGTIILLLLGVFFLFLLLVSAA